MSRALATAAGLALAAGAAAQPCSTLQLGSLDVPAPAAVRVLDGVAYIATADGVLTTRSIVDPGEPLPMDAMSVPGGMAALAITDGYAFVACTGPSTLDVIDIASPWDMFPVATLPLEARRLEVVGEVLVAATLGASGNGLLLLDIANPAVPVDLGFVPFAAEPADLALENGFAFVTFNEGAAQSLLVVDIRDPSAPEIVSALTLPVDPFGIDVDDGLAVIGSLDGTVLMPVEVRDPRAPAAYPPFEIGTPGFDVEVKAGKAFVSGGPGGLVVVDVLFPMSPELVSVFGTPEDAVGVTLDRHVAYVSGDPGGVCIVDAWTWLACSPADQAEPFRILSGHDIGTFVYGFEAGEPHTDLNGNSVLDLSDVVRFIDLFYAGCAEGPAR